MNTSKTREKRTADAMNEYGTVVEAGTVRLERLLPGPIERVWAYLTESDKRGQWFAAGPMEPSAGGRIELEFHNSKLSPRFEPTPERYQQYEGATFAGRVTQFDPPRLLAYTWGEAWGDDSEVTFELTPRGKDVHLVLTHRRLADRAAMVSVASGWHTHIEFLIDLLHGRELPGFWSTHARLEAEYETRIPAQ
jgi:uncharacterized protein YndB with AHSA1/START domain